ncbi:MAG: AEC family transporter [Verrucomicrobiota bacterium]
MPPASAVVSAIAELFGLFALGWFIRRRGYAQPDDLHRWGRIATEIFYPCLIFNSIVRDFDAARVRELWVLPVLAFSMMTAGAAVGWAFRGAMRSRDPDVRRTFVHLCAMNNFIYLPIFIIQKSALPAGVLADFFVFNLGSTIGFWTIGILTLGGTADWRGTLKHLTSPAILSMFLAIGLACAGGKNWLPAPVLGVCQSAGSISVPLMLVIIGASIHGSFRRDQARDLTLISFLRLAALPAVSYLLIKAAHLNAHMEQIALIVALMPTSAVSPVMARLYGGSPAFAAAATLLTHVLSVATVPLAFWLLAR